MPSLLPAYRPLQQVMWPL